MFIRLTIASSYEDVCGEGVWVWDEKNVPSASYEGSTIFIS